MNTLTKGLLGLACACLIALGIYLKGYHDSDTKHLLEAQSAALAFNKKQEEEREKSQAALADISKQWQEYLAQKSSVAQGTIDRLRCITEGFVVRDSSGPAVDSCRSLCRLPQVVVRVWIATLALLFRLDPLHSLVNQDHALS